MWSDSGARNRASSRADCGGELEVIGEILERNTVGIAEVRPNNDALVGRNDKGSIREWAIGSG